MGLSFPTMERSKEESSFPEMVHVGGGGSSLFLTFPLLPRPTSPNPISPAKEPSIDPVLSPYSEPSHAGELEGSADLAAWSQAYSLSIGGALPV